MQRLNLPFRAIAGSRLAAAHGATHGTSWKAFTVLDLNPISDATLATGDVMTRVVVRNRTTTHTTYVLTGSSTGGATPAVGAAFRLLPGESFDFDLAAVANGAYPDRISLRGTSTPVTVDLTAWVARPGNQ